MYSEIKCFVLRLGLACGVYISKLKPTSKESMESFFANLKKELCTG